MARSAVTSYYKSYLFKNRQYDPYNVYTNPNEALCAYSFQSIYTQMRCGLLEPEPVIRVGALLLAFFMP